MNRRGEGAGGEGFLQWGAITFKTWRKGNSTVHGPGFPWGDRELGKGKNSLVSSTEGGFKDRERNLDVIATLKPRGNGTRNGREKRLPTESISGQGRKGNTNKTTAPTRGLTYPLGPCRTQVKGKKARAERVEMGRNL